MTKKEKNVKEVMQYFGQIIMRMKALKPAVWEWDKGIKKLTLYVPSPEYTHLQRSEAQYSVPMTEEEIIFLCHARTDVENLIAMVSGQAEEVKQLRKQVDKLNKRKAKNG